MRTFDTLTFLEDYVTSDYESQFHAEEPINIIIKKENDRRLYYIEADRTWSADQQVAAMDAAWGARATKVYQPWPKAIEGTYLSQILT